MMSPILSPDLMDMKLRTTFFATLIRLGAISSASIESEISNTTMISWGIRVVLVILVVILAPHTIDKRIVIMIIRSIQSIQTLLGVRRYFAIRAFGATIQIFSRPKKYQMSTIIGSSKKMRGNENAIIFLAFLWVPYLYFLEFLWEGQYLYIQRVRVARLYYPIVYHVSIFLYL